MNKNKETNSTDKNGLRRYRKMTLLMFCFAVSSLLLAGLIHYTIPEQPQGEISPEWVVSFCLVMAVIETFIATIFLSFWLRTKKKEDQGRDRQYKPIE